MVGNGPEMELFQEQARTSNYNSRIHFEGFQASPQSYMRAADIFVLASRRESFGLVLVEARQAGCAIIASDVDGIPEALDHGAAGILFPPSDIPQLTKELTPSTGTRCGTEILAGKGSRWNRAIPLHHYGQKNLRDLW